MPADDKRTEIVEDADTPDPHARTSPHPFRFRHRVKAGTLPRLRFGRSYAFRAWQVDLAGNVRPAPGPALPVAPDDLTATLEQTRAGDAHDRARRRRAALERGAARDHRGDPAHHPCLGAAAEAEPELRAGRRAARRPREPDARPDPAAPGRTRTRGGRVSARPGRLARRRRPSATPPVRSFADTDPRRRREPVAVRRGASGARRPRRQPLGGRGRGAQDGHQTRAVPAVGPGAAARRGCPLAATARASRCACSSSAAASPRTSPRCDDHGDRPGRRTPPSTASTTRPSRAAPRAAEDDASSPPSCTASFDDGIGDGATELSRADAMLAIALAEDGSLLDVDRADLDYPAAPVSRRPASPW